MLIYKSMNNTVSNPYISIKALDLNYIFNGVEHFAAILLVIFLARYILNKPNSFSKNIKNLIWILIGVWSIAIVVQYIANTYNYYHASRPYYVQAQRNKTGL
jgi:hypothetical protein